MRRLIPHTLFLSALLVGTNTLFAILPCEAQEELDIAALRRELQTAHTNPSNPAGEPPNSPAAQPADIQGSVEQNDAEFLNGTDKPVAPVQDAVGQAKQIENKIDQVGTLTDNAFDDQAGQLKAVSVKEKSKPSEKPQAPVKQPSDEAINAPLIKNENTAYLNDENQSLKNQVSDLKKKLEAKSDDLEKVRNRLVIAETQVERLSSIIEQRNNTTLQAAGMPPANQQAASQARASLPAPSLQQASQPDQSRRQPVAQAPAAQASAPDSDMLIATVVANKANLRTGPGSENSPLMTVNKGTRLAVETRQGTWYRVISPNGSRAWVTGDVLNFETQGNVKVGAYVAQKREF